jgi:hypothetical protein
MVGLDLDVEVLLEVSDELVVVALEDAEDCRGEAVEFGLDLVAGLLPEHHDASASAVLLRQGHQARGIHFRSTLNPAVIQPHHQQHERPFSKYF